MTIKKVTLKELGELDQWKMNVDPIISGKVQRYLIDNCGCFWYKINKNINNIKHPFLYFGLNNDNLFGFDTKEYILGFNATEAI